MLFFLPSLFRRVLQPVPPPPVLLQPAVLLPRPARPCAKLSKPHSVLRTCRIGTKACGSFLRRKFYSGLLPASRPAAICENGYCNSPWPGRPVCTLPLCIFSFRLSV